MQVIKELDKIVYDKKSAVTVGTFDGVHLGHQSVIRQLRQRADLMNLPAVVLTFEPLPLEYFSPKSARPQHGKINQRTATHPE